MLMAMTLSSVRTGRCFRFSTTSLLIKLLVGYDYALRQGRELMHFAARKASVAKHPIVLRERIGVAMRGGAQHHHAEGRLGGGRHAIFVWDELERYRAATGRQRCIDFSEQRFISLDIEVVQEIRDQRYIVAAPKVYVERAAGESGIPVRNTGSLGVFFGNLEHRGPIEGHDCGVWIVFCNADAEESVTGRDVQNFPFLAGIRADDFGDQLCGPEHKRGHSVGKIHPYRIIRTDGALVADNGATFSHDRGEVIESASLLSDLGEKLRDAS